MPEFSLQISKTAAGFGIIFAKRCDAENVRSFLVVDGFTGDQDVMAPDDPRSQLCLGDTLVSINDNDCSALDALDTVALLRAAQEGNNVLRFHRAEGTIKEEEAQSDNQQQISIRTTVMGALLKVKTKIQAEIERDDELQQKEEEENARFEQEWLAEFAQLRAEYQVKWDTCTHTAHEFCAQLYHSSDAQQQAYLVREYPLLMEEWRDVDLATNPTRVRPDWPAVTVAYTDCVAYCDQRLRVAPSTSPEKPSSEPRRLTVRATSSLCDVVAVLRKEFQWTEEHVDAVLVQLEAAEIHSCSSLLQALRDRRGASFDRTFQSRTYPRVTKPMMRRLAARAQEIEQLHESTQDLCMDALPVNPH